MKFRCCTILIMLFSFVEMSFAQMQDLRKTIDSLITGKDLTLGLSVCDFQTGEMLSINETKRLPMQSVYKFQIGLAVLDDVDRGCYTLSDTIVIAKNDLSPDLWSPIRESYPDGVSMPLWELITYAVSQSDNSASDLLLSKAGGPRKVQKYIHSKGVKQMSIENYEREIQASWKLQFKNNATPAAMMQLLKLFNDEKLLKSNSQRFMWGVMAQTQTGSFRRSLPSDLVIARKTGHSGQNNDGVTAANNDVGIIVLPDGRRIAYVIFIADSKEEPEMNYTLIAQIGSAIYRNFSK